MTDMFGIEIQVGDIVAVFKEYDDSFTGVKDVSYHKGVIKEIEEYPTGLGRIEVEYSKWSERAKVEYPKDLKKELHYTSTDNYWNYSIFKYSTLREVIPEYFL